MYDELVKRLRDKARLEREYNSTGALEDEAADAIEELLTLKAKKKRPPKRLPCTCGRKQLDLWWSDNPSDKGWFLKCPNCGRQSQPERYMINVNSAWNNGLPEPPKEET